MEVSVDSIIKKPFCCKNYEKLKIAKTEKPTSKLDILSSKLGCLKIAGNDDGTFVKK